ncbi:hypothetical protein GCM10009117_00080 [Gangjinia marincola]|uniref:Uncharacterized protein n=1 Tax=Gangjinia marincola TaxID=578463 RepID=A0ABP3XRD0_9FLAO
MNKLITKETGVVAGDLETHLNLFIPLLRYKQKEKPENKIFGLCKAVLFYA